LEFEMRNGKDRHVATIIGPGVTFEGTLVSQAGLRIEGNLRGRVECDGALIVSATAKVEAEIICEEIYVAGEVRGNITGKNLVEVTQRGKIIGNITAANLVMEPGALFEGQCNMNHRSGDEERDSHDLPAFPSAHIEDQPSSEAGG
jgi:cytoskeletal protein CcmA (bactofilin family)